MLTNLPEVLQRHIIELVTPPAATTLARLAWLSRPLQQLACQDSCRRVRKLASSNQVDHVAELSSLPGVSSMLVLHTHEALAHMANEPTGQSHQNLPSDQLPRHVAAHGMGTILLAMLARSGVYTSVAVCTGSSRPLLHHCLKLVHGEIKRSSPKPAHA